MKWLTTLSALILCVNFCHAQRVGIDRRHHTPNVSGGYCLPASVETVGRYHGHRTLVGYRDWKKEARGGYPAYGGMVFPEIAYDLRQRKIRYEIKGEGPAHKYDGWLRNHLHHRRPVVVTVRSRDNRPPDHAVVLTTWDNKGVSIVNPNPPHIKRWTHTQWAHRYAGGGLVIYPPSNSNR